MHSRNLTGGESMDSRRASRQGSQESLKSRMSTVNQHNATGYGDHGGMSRSGSNQQFTVEKYAKVLFDFTAENSGELSCKLN
jgi:hypothetical protein